MLDKGLEMHAHIWGSTLHADQQSCVGRTACSVTYRLAALIGDHQSWRVAALVSTAHQLARRLDRLAAAKVAAAAAHEFTCGIAHKDHRDADDVGALAARAVDSNNEALVENLALIIARRLAPKSRSKPLLALPR
jgi:hypothetical protein